MYPQFVCCRYKYRERRRSRNLLNPHKKRKRKMCFLGRMGTMYICWMLAQCNENSESKHCIAKLNRPTYKTKDENEWLQMIFSFFMWWILLRFFFVDKYGWVFRCYFRFVGCEIFKSKKIFLADFVWIRLYIMRR